MDWVFYSIAEWKENMNYKVLILLLSCSLTTYADINTNSLVSCNKSVDLNLYRQSIIKIKQFAYNRNGLDMSPEESTPFALEWVKHYPCEVVDQYIVDAKRLIAFVSHYNSPGLYYSHDLIIKFVEDKVTDMCRNVNFEEMFLDHYNFAYSRDGLDMSQENANNYAYEMIYDEAFSCKNLPYIIN